MDRGDSYLSSCINMDENLHEAWSLVENDWEQRATFGAYRMQCTVEPASPYWPSIETLGSNSIENQLYNEIAVTSDTEVFRSEADSLQHQHFELQPASIDNVSSHISRSVDYATPNDLGSAHGLPPAHRKVSGFNEDSRIWNKTHSDSGWWGQSDSSVISPPRLSSVDPTILSQSPMPNEESFHAASGIISNSFFPQEIIAASSYNDLVSFEHNLAFGSHLVGSAACHLVSNNETLSRNADLTLREVAINEKSKLYKPRLPCTHSGCKATFPRRYELERHLDSVHKLIVNILCPVYGCNRTSRPFPRIDKFREHVRNHKNPEKFLCFIESCHIGPLTQEELKAHLGTQHLHDYSDQPHLALFMKILPFLGSKNFPTSPGGWALFEIAKLRLDGKDRCPLQSLGCAFRLSIEDPDMLRHIRRHDLKDRAAVPNILREKWIGTDCVKIGVAACPICKASICSENEEFLKLANHLVESHTEMERSTHIETISKILGVFYDERGDYFGPWTKSENERGDYFGPWTKSESERFHRGDSFRNLMQEDLVARFKGMWKHDKTSEYGYFRWLNICEQQNEILWEFARAQVRSAHALEDNSATVRTDKKQAPCKGDMKAVPAKLHGASRAP